jgi:hypothetical protein
LEVAEVDEGEEGCPGVVRDAILVVLRKDVEERVIVGGRARISNAGVEVTSNDSVVDGVGGVKNVEDGEVHVVERGGEFGGNIHVND